MDNRAALLGVVALSLTGWGCASPPPWKLPPGLSNGSRVRVVAPRLGKAWQPGRIVLSTKGCWMVEAAVTHDPDAIAILTPRELSRLQVSKAIPPPDWWVVPEEAEGWTEMLPSDLEEAQAPACRHPGPEVRQRDTAELLPDCRTWLAASRKRDAPPREAASRFSAFRSATRFADPIARLPPPSPLLDAAARQP
jgi:hypothetical protein